MIDWSELKPYENNKNRSFEELCYQIAHRLYHEKGRLISIDDSGGGDGVEFYLTLDNGDEWGWQAKFYYPQKRLNISNRKQSIINSLKKACEVHPNLRKWILCTPTNFTPTEQDWFDSELPNSIPDGMCVKIEHWGDSKFNNWLSDLKFRGIPNYFFGKLELDLEWFKTQFEKQMAGIGDRVDSSLHTETRVDANLYALLGDQKFVQQITKLIKKTKKDLPDLEERIINLKGQIPNEIKWEEEEKSKVIDAAESLQRTLVNTINQFEKAIEFLNNKKISEAQAIDWAFVFSQLEEAHDIYETIGNESGISKIKYIGEGENERQVRNKVIDIIHRPSYLVISLFHSFYSIKQWFELINQSDLHIFGDAGVGKTHIACNICSDRLRTGLPALFIRGSLFTTDQTLEEQLLRILHIPQSYSWHDFLQALSASAEAYHTRIPLIIDGLNESIHNGTFSNVWRLGLKGLVQEILGTSNIVLITTYRTSYKEAIWGDESPLNIIAAEGFVDYDDLEQGVKKYFHTYKIVADPLPSQLTQFQIPIYLKIFCETINPNRQSEIHIDVHEWTLFEVFERYLEQCNQNVSKRLDLEPEARVVQSELNKVAEYLWQYRRRYIDIEDMAYIIDKQPLQELKKSTSKMRALEDEGLLVFRDWVEDTEMISFTYDLLGGYLIAQHLVRTSANHKQSYLRRAVLNIFGKEHKDLHPFLNKVKKYSVDLLPLKIRRSLHNLLGHKTAHPLYDDIGSSLAALLPSKTGKYLHEFSNNEMVLRYSIHALFEIAPQDINENCVKLVARRFKEHRQDRQLLLKLAETTVGHPNHPFRASFWSDQLSALSMVERDLSWSEHVRLYREKFEELLIRFEESCQSDQELSDNGKERLHLLAEYIMWILTSTVRPLRDIATRALYWYGRRFPNEFFDLVLKSFTINDPYVSERMLAATYGIAMARQNDLDDTSFVDEMLPKYAEQLYESMFKLNAPHTTTHILARDYAKRTIDIALIYKPDLLSDEERGRITPPFTDGGIRVWGESEDRNKGEYEKGPGPLQIDFENYTLGTLVKGRASYNNKHPEYKRVVANIRWRIYDLGFSLERYGKIDRWLAEDNYRKFGRSGDGRKIDRYGKKYSWIAFFELAGFRQDQVILPNFNDNDRRIEADIDPSFPDKHREYNLVREDFLGDRERSTEQWVSKTPHPDLTPYVNVDQLCEEQGSWVLLRGYLSQEVKQVNRSMFVWLQGLIVKSDEVEEIVDILNRQENIDGHTVPFIPEDYRTYAGEIPWSDTFPTNGWEDFSFEIEKDIVLHEQLELLRDGEPISLYEEFQFWHSAPDLIEIEDEEILKARLSEHNLKIEKKMVEVEQPKYQQFEALVPVRDNCWEESCSAANPHRSIAIPAREIADSLDLYGHPQSFDLFEKVNGKRASISFRDGEIWGNVQHFTYLREDLLKRYLAEIGGELIWVIWGNRRQVSQNPNDPYENFQEVKTYHDIQKAFGDS